MAKASPLIDTSVFIEALRGNKKMNNFLRGSGHFYYSVITRKELFRKKGLSSAETVKIEKLLSGGTMLFLNTLILEGFRILKPIYNKKNIDDNNDIIVAATALSKNIPLATLNKKHFSFIKSIKMIKL